MVAGYFVPIVLVVAGVTFAIWATVGPEPRMAHALIMAPASWKVEKDPSDGGASVHQGGATLCID